MPSKSWSRRVCGPFATIRYKMNKVDKNILYDLISKGNVEVTMETIVSNINESHLEFKNFILLKGQLSNLNKEVNLGLITQDNFQVERNRIAKAVLDNIESLTFFEENRSSRNEPAILNNYYDSETSKRKQSFDSYVLGRSQSLFEEKKKINESKRIILVQIEDQKYRIDELNWKKKNNYLVSEKELKGSQNYMKDLVKDLRILDEKQKTLLNVEDKIDRFVQMAKSSEWNEAVVKSIENILDADFFDILPPGEWLIYA